MMKSYYMTQTNEDGWAGTTCDHQGVWNLGMSKMQIIWGAKSVKVNNVYSVQDDDLRTLIVKVHGYHLPSSISFTPLSIRTMLPIQLPFISAPCQHSNPDANSLWTGGIWFL
jgi:hypothetical protein